MLKSCCCSHDHSCRDHKADLGTTNHRVHPTHHPFCAGTTGGQCLTSAQLQSYQVQLLETPGITLKICTILNPATLIPDGDDTTEHSCQEVLEEVYSSREGLSDISLLNLDLVLFTDGSSFIDNGRRRAGYAVVTLFETIEAEPMPPGTSAQAAKIKGLMRMLQLAKGKKVNVFTDFQYAFSTLHVFGATWKHWGLLGTRGGGVKHWQLILDLLQAVHEPEEVSVMHCKVNQRGDTEIHEGNHRANAAAKCAAKEPFTEAQVPLILDLSLASRPKYQGSDQDLLQNFPSLSDRDGGRSPLKTGWLFQGISCVMFSYLSTSQAISGLKHCTICLGNIALG